MAVLNIGDINDLVTASRPHEGLYKMNDIASRLTHYEFISYMIREDKIVHDGGTSIKGNLVTDHNFSAAMVGLHQVIEPNIPDVMQKWDVPWRHCNSHWGYERREILANSRGRTLTQIVNILDTRRVPARISEAELLETQWWTNTPVSTDDKNIYGIKYWLPQRAAAGRGFDGGAPSGFTDVAGLNPSTYTRWKCYQASYVDFTETDLLHEMNLAADEINFVPPVDIEEHKRGVGRNHRICLNLTTKVNLEEEMRARNDRHSSLSDFANAVSFRNSPLRYVPKLNSDTKNPVYMTNQDYVFVACLAGDEQYEHPPMNDVKQPSTYIVHRECSLNVVMTNRRVHVVINQV